MLRSFLCASTAAVVIRYVNPAHSFKMVLYEVDYQIPWFWFEMPFFIFLGICGGLLGAFFIRLNVYVCQMRKSSFVSNYPVQEVMMNITITSLVCYYSPFLRMNSAELIGKLFSDCEGSFQYDELYFICRHGAVWKTLGGLTLAFLVKFFFTVVTVGTKVPAGLLIPSLVIGSCFGRIIGILVEYMYLENQDSFYFSECRQSGCVTPGVYSMVGAAAMLAGVSRTTVSIAVIMYELTGGLTFMVPVMLAVLASKWIGDSLTEGIYDENISVSGYPYIDPKKEVMIPTPCHKILYQKQIYVCQAHGDNLAAIYELCKNLNVHGFPVVSNASEMSVVGYVSRTKLKRAIENALKLGFELESTCTFQKVSTQGTVNSSRFSSQKENLQTFIQQGSVDFSYLVDLVG